MIGNTNVITMRHGDHAWSIRIIVDSKDIIDIYNSPDEWLESAEAADFERKRIARMLSRISGPVGTNVSV